MTAEEMDTRGRLVAAATKLFAQNGFDGTSVKALADEAGVNISLISYHFGGKENLYRTTLEQFGQARLAVAERMLHKAESFEEFRLRLKTFVEEWFTCHSENREVIRILNRECDMNTPIVQDIFRDTFLKVFDTMVGFFRSAQQLRLIREDLDAEMMARFFFGSLVHIGRTDDLTEKYYGKSLRDPVYRELVMNQIVSFCTHGCVGQAGETRKSP